MKAYNLHGINDLRYEDVEIPELNPEWALVKVKASGICSSDIPRIFTKGTYHFPTIPGHEFSGIVEQVNSSKRELIGKKVSAFPLIPCMKCTQCKLGHYEMCDCYDYIGSRRDGGFAEYVAVPIWNLVFLDDNVTFEDAAMMEPLSVAVHAVKKLEVKFGDTVAIVGTGMIAFACAHIALMNGASKVSLLGRTNDKKKLIYNIDNLEFLTIDSVEKKFDKVIEAVGSNDAIDKAIGICNSGGIIVMIGNPDGDILLKQDVYWRILRKQLIVKGTWNSSYNGLGKSDWTEAQKLIASEGNMINKLITHRFKSDSLAVGLDLMKNKKEIYCKVMMLWN